MKKLIIGLTLLGSTSAFSANMMQTNKKLMHISECASSVTQEKIQASECDKIIKSALRIGVSRDEIKKAMIKGRKMGASVNSAESATFAQLEREIIAERRQQQQKQQMPQGQ